MSSASTPKRETRVQASLNHDRKLELSNGGNAEGGVFMRSSTQLRKVGLVDHRIRVILKWTWDLSQFDPHHQKVIHLIHFTFPCIEFLIELIELPIDRKGDRIFEKRSKPRATQLAV